MWSAPSSVRPYLPAPVSRYGYQWRMWPRPGSGPAGLPQPRGQWQEAVSAPGSDEIFFRLGVEQSDDLLQRIKTVENPNFQDNNGTSYLHRACQSHYLEAIKLLLNMGADPNINDKKGVSPILKAIGRIHEDNNIILEIMLQHGLDLDKMEGDMTLKAKIESFDDDEMNKILKKYYHK